jgi:hypothetical protein
MRPAHNRKNKAGESVAVKESSVVAYFAHHPEVDRTQVDECELRSAKITIAQRQSIETKSRNQRRKILQNHCWKIIKTSLNLSDPERIPEILESEFIITSRRHSLDPKKMLNSLIEDLCNGLVEPTYLKANKKSLEYGMTTWRNDILTNPHRCPDRMRSALTLWSQSLEIKMQVAIVGEAMDFLSQKMQRPILNLLVYSGLYKWLMTKTMCTDKMSLSDRLDIANTYAMPVFHQDSPLNSKFKISMVNALESLIDMNINNFMDLLGFVSDDVAQSLSMIDWGGEFERLEQKKKITD